MNRLWVRLSLAFAGVLIAAMIMSAIVVQLNYAEIGAPPPPPEVLAYFEQIRATRIIPNPFIAFLIVGGIAIIAGVVASRMLASPLSDLEEAAANLGKGDLSTRVEPHGSQEMVAVGLSFNDMAKQLEQAETLRQNLLSDVAHELRHPLHVLQGNLQAMQDGVYPVNEEEIDRLMAQTRHLTVMVNDLHVLAQAEANRLPLHVRKVDIAEMVKDVTAAYQPLAATENIDLHVELLGSIPEFVELDRARIRQALQNLLENSLRHTADKGHITITVSQNDRNLSIEVWDDGEGIAADQLPYVFDRLYRGDPARQGDSTGLGLAISKALVEVHGGTITAESPGIGRGSTFTITLPT